MLDHELLRFDNYTLTLARVVYVLLLVMAVFLLLFLIKRIVYRAKRFTEGQQFTLYTIIKYFVIVVFISAAMKLLGVDVSVLVAGSAALLVGIGLGLQNLFYDFISGIIILVDGSIKVGNVIQIGDKRVEVLAIRLRTSLVKTREEHEIIVPNSLFTKNEIINWSTQRNINRHFVELKVLDKDVERAMEIMEKIAVTHPKVARKPPPYARIEKFYDHAVEIKLLFWSEEVLTVGRLLGDIRLLILHAFRENNISSPQPGYTITTRPEPQKE
jgi:small-conductance mechanosensitive channel